MWTDRILAMLAILTMIAFVGVIIVRVPHIDLVIVCLITIVLASYDFYRTLRARRED